MPKVLDSYQQWEKDGVVKKKLKEIVDLSAKKINQSEIAKQLGVSEKTFISLKRKHSKIKDAIYQGKDRMKTTLVNAMFELAVGATSEDEHKKVEKLSNGTKKEHIQIHKKKEKPDFKAIRYLLIINFGKDYNEKRRELDLMEKRLNSREEQWNNASDTEKD